MHWIYAHLIGDYLIQTDWMAKNKKISSLACLLHVICYLIPFMFTKLSYLAILVIGIEHFIQDRTTIVTKLMILTGSEDFTKPPMSPWSVIIVDNILHVLFIALIESLNI